MKERAKIELYLPAQDGTNINILFDTSKNIILIGANGSGKTKLGAWIEMNHKTNLVHRISAQRALLISEYIPPRTLINSQNELFWGSQESRDHNLNSKPHHRWNYNLTTSLENDFNTVLSVLIAERRSLNDDYIKKIEKCTNNQDKNEIPLPKSNIHKAIQILNDLFPYITLSFENEQVVVNHHNGIQYHGKNMSDGERVVLYLIGQSLSIPPNSIIIIDEPELHLHKSLMNRLWNQIEVLKSDCLFIYITHDLDFASNHVNATKIWIKEYLNENKWKWMPIPEAEGLPQNLTMEILGNRKKVIFSEGDRGSLDYKIYSEIYPDFLIYPCGGCTKVIEATKTFKENSNFHYISAFGIIDRDYHTESELKVLEKYNIYALKVAEIENLICSKEILEIITIQLKLPKSKIDDIIKMIIGKLESELEIQVSNFVMKQIQFILSKFENKQKTEQELKVSLENLYKSINVTEMYRTVKSDLETIIHSKDYNKILLYYNRKSLIQQISSLLDLKSSAYKDLFLRLMNSELKNQIITGLKLYTPNIEF